MLIPLYPDRQQLFAALVGGDGCVRQDKRKRAPPDSSERRPCHVHQCERISIQIDLNGQSCRILIDVLIMDEDEVARLIEEQEELRRETDLTFGKKCVNWCFLLIVLPFFILLFAPSLFRSRKKMEMTQAISNSKQAYLVLLDFESDFGYFPDDSSSASDPMLTVFHGPYSNDYLGQLIAGGYTKSEEIFYAIDKRYKLRADDVISPPTSILDTNECGFSYVMVEIAGSRRGLNSKDNLGLPILLAPLVNKWGSFEKTNYKNRGVYLRVDGSARSELLNPSDQKIRLSDGNTLFESGPSTMWGNLTPVVLLPER